MVAFKSPSLNSYGTLQPKGPNFLLSSTFADHHRHISNLLQDGGFSFYEYGQLFVSGKFEAAFNGYRCFELKATGGLHVDVKVSNIWGKCCLTVNFPERSIPRSSKYIGIGVLTNPVHLRSEPTVSRSVIRDEGVFLYVVQSGIRVVNTSAQTCSPVQINNYRNLQPNLSVIRLDDILDDVTHEISQRGLRT